MCNAVTPLKGPFLAENLHTKQNTGRPLCPVSNMFFKASIYVAVVSLLEALLARPFIDFRGEQFCIRQFLSSPYLY